MITRRRLYIVSILALFSTIVWGVGLISIWDPGPSGEGFWPFSVVLICSSLGVILAATAQERKTILGVMLIFITIGCIVGATLVASISTMFGGSVGEQAGNLYGLWFLVPSVLWVAYYVYLRTR